MCKDVLPNRGFPLWDWMYAIEDLIKKHLQGPWIDGYIKGATIHFYCLDAAGGMCSMDAIKRTSAIAAVGSVTCERK